MNKAVAKLDCQGEGTLVPMHPTPAVSDAGQLMDVLVREASNPNCNPDKMIAMHSLLKEIRADENERMFNAAMATAQAEMRRIAADSDNPQTRSRYASYAAIDRAIRPIYTQNGFALSFGTEDGAPEQCVRIVCHVTCSGHTRKYHIDMPADGKGAKGGDVMTRTHATGAAVTYGRRYLLAMIFNLAIGQDDDGNGAAPDAPDINGVIGPQQMKALQEKIARVAIDIEKVCKFAHVESLGEITVGKFQRVMNGIDAWAARAAGAGNGN